MRPGSDGDCPVQGLRPRRPSRGGSALLGPAKPKAAWVLLGAFLFFFFFTVATAPRGAALALSLQAQGPLETCVTATASHM